MRLRFLLSTTFLLAPLAGLHATPAASKPNVVLILADDMGFSDPGGYGGEIATPRLPV
jgi:arylsulfatase